MRRFAPAVALTALVACAEAAEEAPKEFAARHVLVAYKGAERSRATRTKEEAKARAEEALAELRKPGADFAAVSRKYSDDTVSDAQGGFLGIFEPGTMTPVFQSALESLPEGGLSGVVETPFGFHVMQRLSIAQAIEAKSNGTAVLAMSIFPWKGGMTPDRSAPPERTKEEALAAAAKAVELLRAGTPSHKLPPELGARNGRQPLQRGTARPEFKALEDAAFALGAGKISDPIESPVGWIVARRVPYFRASVRHFLVMHEKSERRPPGVTRTRDQALARAQEGLAKVKADPSSWGKVVAEYSDEPGAGPRQGSLDVVEPGDMTPVFEDGILATPPGGISDIVETEFGFHVIQRLN